ncbi:hypothetical protein TTRE_0000433401 [Trichuris trichiura]|uniref:Uncharacterized protein n=1 Tax=Trichuris trichiura TaxID=36087 RepID=A0A077ZBT1_TRITR|nr:hypothetical protein TTRE_0000433401 [Trichuris trichiura]
MGAEILKDPIGKQARYLCKAIGILCIDVNVQRSQLEELRELCSQLTEVCPVLNFCFPLALGDRINVIHLCHSRTVEHVLLQALVDKQSIKSVLKLCRRLDSLLQPVSKQQVGTFGELSMVSPVDQSIRRPNSPSTKQGIIVQCEFRQILFESGKTR